MRILDSTLTFSILKANTQPHQPLLSALKHLNNNCDVDASIENYVTHSNY